MSKTFNTMMTLIARGEIRISEHGYDELSADKLTVRELVAGVADAVVVEDYSHYPKGPCVLVLQREMNKRKRTKYIHEGKYVAEIEVELLEDENGWSPYLSLQDAYRLDDVREALRSGDLATASRYAKVFSLTPVAV